MASIQGWGRETWNSGAWSQQAPVSVTGNGLTSSLGTETVSTDQNISVTGVGLTSSRGSTTITGALNLTLDGVSATSSIGSNPTVSVSINVTISAGVSTTSSIGSPSVSLTSTTGWNRDTDVNTGNTIGWGDQQWGAVGLSQAVTGNQLTSVLGDESPITDQNISVTSVSTTSSIGTFSISGDGQITIVAGSEVALQSSVGTAQADPEVKVFVSGNQLSSAVGTVGTSVFLTGLGTTLNLGDAGQETSYLIPGVSATSSFGTLNVRTDTVFTVTGISGTSAVGNLQGTFWSQVDDSNSDISWTEVHKAA